MFIFGSYLRKFDHLLPKLELFKRYCYMLKLATIALPSRLCSFLMFMVFFIGANLTLNAQSNPLVNQAKVADYLGDSRFNDLLESNSSYLDFLDMRCSKGYSIIDMALEKTVGMTGITSIDFEEWSVPTKPDETISTKINHSLTAADFVTASSTSEFNFLKYHFQFDRSEITFYVLGETGKVIMIHPVEYINKQLAASN